MITLSDPPFEVEMVSSVCGVPDESIFKEKKKKKPDYRSLTEEEYAERSAIYANYRIDELKICNDCGAMCCVNENCPG